MKRKFLAIILSVGIISMCFVSVSAATMKKTMKSSHSTTTIQATATYYTHEKNRWQTSNPQILTTSGKGGGAAKSGGLSTSQSGSEYKAIQKYTISATNDNYVTTTSTKTYQWVVNGTSNSWVTSKCYVY